MCAIGLSAGFIEPLESTGVALIITGIEQLCFAIESRGYTENHKQTYNRIMAGYFEDCIDFVSMHYENVERDEPFWKWVKETWIKSDRQLHFEEQMLRTDCHLPVPGFGYVFCAANWICWLIQLGKHLNPALDGYTPEQARAEILSWKNFEDSRFTRSISHTKYIQTFSENKFNA